MRTKERERGKKREKRRERKTEREGNCKKKLYFFSMIIFLFILKIILEK
jgi:hypothetical protein